MNNSEKLSKIAKEIEKLSKIAKEILQINTLVTRNSDSLDFYDLAVWNIKAALDAAYNEGYAQGYNEASSKEYPNFSKLHPDEFALQEKLK